MIRKRRIVFYSAIKILSLALYVSLSASDKVVLWLNVVLQILLCIPSPFSNCITRYNVIFNTYRRITSQLFYFNSFISFFYIYFLLPYWSVHRGLWTSLCSDWSHNWSCLNCKSPCLSLFSNVLSCTSDAHSRIVACPSAIRLSEPKRRVKGEGLPHRE